MTIDFTPELSTTKINLYQGNKNKKYMKKYKEEIKPLCYILYKKSFKRCKKSTAINLPNFYEEL